ncbi:S-adenosyl-L-methionine-dependent methyltransferase [Xylariaceae sp. FL1019]|nr:S-adenosyl-L-methionine-dependent methyltransferase [Xylariaceae sp. FL1019]
MSSPNTNVNIDAWDSFAKHWNPNVVENDMYRECLLPTLRELAGIGGEDEQIKVLQGQWALDLGTGDGLIAEMLRKAGAFVIAVDASQEMRRIAENRFKGNKISGIELKSVNLQDKDSLSTFVTDMGEETRRFDLITCSLTLKELPRLDLLAEALPKLLKPDGRVVVVDLHPVLSKPAGHRVMEVKEDEKGTQIFPNHIEVTRYLDIPPVPTRSYKEEEGVPLVTTTYHRSVSALLQPFFENQLVMDAMREPGLKKREEPRDASKKSKEPLESYRRFDQFPMLLAFRLRKSRSVADPKFAATRQSSLPSLEYNLLK